MSPRSVSSFFSCTLVTALLAGCSDIASTPDQPGTQPNLALAQDSGPTLAPQQSGTTNRLQAISPVNDLVAWASGTGGTYTITTDGGATWKAGVVPGAGDLEFRDVEAISATSAYLMSAGPGTLSRIYRTDDGGQSWQLQFTNTDPLAFYDCFDFWTSNRGLTMSDAVNGIFPVVRTTDGQTWQNIGANLPAAQTGEAAFAASGTCIVTAGERHAWIGTGAAPQARILATTDGGKTWSAYGVPIVQGTPSSGIVTLAFRDLSHGILGGGELADLEAFVDNVATTSDGGKTWALAARSPFPGAIYGLDYVKGLGVTVVITGPKGAAWSSDEGQTWARLPGLRNYWAVAFASPSAGWLVGTGGRILKLSF
jgi:photosystem II stability/assembly factor-like uncharacterized protein